MNIIPIGVQSFEKLRTENLTYVDKTALIHRLVTTGHNYFLARPRRFGKSLLLSTLRCYFEGRKELFENLDINFLERKWLKHEVIALDFCMNTGSEPDNLDQILNYQLSMLEKKYGITEVAALPEIRLAEIIHQAREMSGRGVVVLIDEYDRPIIGNPFHTENSAHLRNRLRGIFGVLKQMDSYLRFIFVTGVTNFGRANVFSCLNNLQDISLDSSYATLCGITTGETMVNFDSYLDRMASVNEIPDRESVLQMLADNYGGYHFAGNAEEVINPFSLMNALHTNRVEHYWWLTGTPTFLVNLIADNRYRVEQLELGDCSEEILTNITPYGGNIYSLLYQTGYLTIKDYDSRYHTYQLGYPNQEVASAFTQSLMKCYTQTSKSEFDIREYVADLENGQPRRMMKRLQAFISGIPYTSKTNTEQTFHTTVLVFFKFLGLYVQSEVPSARGRADMIIYTRDYVYIFEFKLDGTPMQALRQIKNRGYGVPFGMSGRRIINIGVEFSSALRGIKRWNIHTSRTQTPSTGEEDCRRR